MKMSVVSSCPLLYCKVIACTKKVTVQCTHFFTFYQCKNISIFFQSDIICTTDFKFLSQYHLVH